MPEPRILTRSAISSPESAGNGTPAARTLSISCGLDRFTLSNFVVTLGGATRASFSFQAVIPGNPYKAPQGILSDDAQNSETGGI